MKLSYGTVHVACVLINVFGRAFACDKTTFNILFQPRTAGCIGCRYVSGEQTYTHLTYVPGTHLRRGDVSKTTTFDFSTFRFTKGFPKIDKCGHQIEES